MSSEMVSPSAVAWPEGCARQEKEKPVAYTQAPNKLQIEIGNLPQEVRTT